MRALGIAVASTVGCTGIVAISLVACLVHLDEVKGAIDATWHVGYVNGKVNSLPKSWNIWYSASGHDYSEQLSM